MDQWNDELNGLFRSYRAAVPDPEAKASFMPELWRRIESRRSIILRVKKLTQVFLAASAAISIVFITMLAVPAFSGTEPGASYVEVLADAYPTEGLAAHGILSRDNAEVNSR
jgi:hypothetical protein